MARLPAALSSEPVGRRQLSAAEQSSLQRDRILDCAVAVFAKRGYPSTSADHVAAAAQIGIGTFYSAFADKEECFLAALDRTLLAARGEIAAELPDRGPAADRVLFALERLCELIAAEPLASRLVFVEAETAGPAARARQREEIERLAPALRACRRQSPYAAELPDSLERATLGGALWYLQQRILRGEAAEAEAFLPELAEVVLAPYLGKREAARLLAARI